MELKGTSAQQDDTAILVYVTVDNEPEAVRIAKEVVSQRLAACANIVPQITSVYRWAGALQEDRETLIFLKTRPTLAEKLREAIVSLHPYDVPAITMVPMSHVHPPYLQWLLEQTQEPEA